MSTPQFIVGTAQLDASEVILEGAEFQHMRVRRLRPGEQVLITDGAGRQRRGVLIRVGRTGAVIQMNPDDCVDATAAGRLTVAVAILKSQKLDLVVEKLTELGAGSILFFTCDRSLPSLSAARLERLARIASSAAKQSQRSVVPATRGPLSYSELIQNHRCQHPLLFWEQAPATPGQLAALSPTSQSAIAVVGPEGGFSAGEASAAIAAGFRPVSLGSRPLRAETAAIVAATLCQLVLGELGPFSLA